MLTVTSTGDPDVHGCSACGSEIVKWKLRCSDVVGGGSLALAAGQWEGRFALRLSETASESGEGLDERAALGHAHLPQLHFLSPSPLLSHFLFYLTPITQVCLVTQDDHHHLFM